MISLRPNLVKRVERLPKPSNVASAMQPLFEAISNSIHSVQEKFGDSVVTEGRIIINMTVGRDKEACRITVEDNGVGLNEANWNGFTTTDTDNKISIGGKGVGRLLWLDCFKEIRVSSVYCNDGLMLKRDFRFTLSNEQQIDNYSNEITENFDHTNCFVQFSGIRNNGYSSKFPSRASVVFQHIASHFLPVLIGGRSPRIEVHIGLDSRVYPQDIDGIVFRKHSNIPVETQEYGALNLTLMECDKTASSDLKGLHFVHFIAHDRTVHTQCIDGRLGLKHFGDNSDRVFHAIVTGHYLDSNVNQERTAFIFEDAILDRIINDICLNEITGFLAGPLSQLSNKQRSIIAEITQSYPSVAFGDTDELQAKLPSGELSDDAIYGHLSRERFRRDRRQAQKIRSVLERLKEGNVDVASFSSLISDAGKSLEESEQRSLAEYVVRRKVVLDFIEILLQTVRHENLDSSYQREEILHSFICPMRVSTVSGGSKKVAAATSHDLWIVDERLTFAQYFSSDEEFSKLAAAFASEDRPDVLIFDYVHGLRQSDSSSKILLIEFKRPGRKAYSDDENPQFQIERYIRRLQSGCMTDVKGRPIMLDGQTVFHCFIVADIVGRLDEWTYSWQRTADGRGRVYQPPSGFRGSIELIGWDALLQDARERNQAFFDKAGISGKSYFSPD